AQPNLNGSILGELKVPVPSSAVQEAAVGVANEQLRLMERLTSDISTALEKGALVKRSVLRTAFARQLHSTTRGAPAESSSGIQDPAKLRRLIVDLIEPETWTGIDADVKGDAYEGLLEKNAADTKSGAGQYFTPRALIKTMVDVTQPRPGEGIADPCCGTGGFL